jgi:hypothetical protein
LWVPDVWAPESAPAAHEQSATIAANEQDLTTKHAISWDWSADEGMVRLSRALIAFLGLA